VLIEEYFQKIEADIASCPYIFESRVLKDKRSLYIGVIQGEIYLIDESVLYFIEFVNVKEKTEGISIHIITRINMEKFYSDMIWHPIIKKLRPFPIISM